MEEKGYADDGKELIIKKNGIYYCHPTYQMLIGYMIEYIKRDIRYQFFMDLDELFDTLTIEGIYNYLEAEIKQENN